MALSTRIRILLVNFASLFYFKKRSKVIFYHDIHSDKKYTEMSTPIEVFKNHIQIILENGYEIVAEITKPIGQIEICFDDAFLGLFENIEMIKKLRIPIQLFVISSYLSKKNHINKEQLIELNYNSLFTISSHTRSHKILTDISDDEIIVELKDSKSELEEILGCEVSAICFPEGKFNNRVIQIANSLNYKKMYSCIPGFYYNEVFHMVKGRSLVQFANKTEFDSILKGGDHLLSFWYKYKYYKK